MIYGSDYGLSITSTTGYGTQVVICLPVLYSAGEENYEESAKDSNR